MALTGNLQAADSWLRRNKSTSIIRFEAAAGGCINETGAIELSNGERLFLKLNPGAPENFFRAEALGLDTLRHSTELRIPSVIQAQTGFLLLEDLGCGTPIKDYWRLLGTGLAQLHSKTYSTFGLEEDNYCGRTPQRNTPTENGFDFFARHRLIALAENAYESDLLDQRTLERVVRLANNLQNYLPEQPAVLIHGDLWSGNVHCDNEGHPTLIDPACYRGWAEAELAMTKLFGGFHPEFYRAYEDESGIDPDWKLRASLYNLYHLLNHLVLFGTGYTGQIESVLSRYC